MTIHKERSARDALATLEALRPLADEPEEFDAAIQQLETLITEYGNFDASLFLIHRIASHALDEQASLLQQGSDLALRHAKAMVSITDIQHFSRRENAEQGPPRPPLVTLEAEHGEE